MEIQVLSRTFQVRPLTEGDVEEVCALCRGNPLFYQYHPPLASRESILADLAALPPGKTPADKHFVGLWEGEALSAVLDLVEHYPAEGTAYLGFFMVARPLQGAGLGSALVEDLSARLGAAGFGRLRLAVDRGNPQSGSFWRKNGFTPVGEGRYIEMERTLTGP